MRLRILPSATSHYIRCGNFDQYFGSEGRDQIEDTKIAEPVTYQVLHSRSALQARWHWFAFSVVEAANQIRRTAEPPTNHFVIGSDNATNQARNSDEPSAEQRRTG